MSLPDSAGQAPASEPIIEQKQRNNIYTMMLILSFLAICVACVLLFLELQEYGTFPTWWKTTGFAPPAAVSSVIAPVPEGWSASAACASCWT